MSASDEDMTDAERREAAADAVGMDDAARQLLGRRRTRTRADGGGGGGHGALRRLYRGETQFDFVGRRRAWFTLSSVVIVAGIISLILRGGLNLGIEFKGGTEWTVLAPGVSQTQAVNAVQGAGLNQPIVQLLGRGGNQQLNVQADLNRLSPSQQKSVTTKVEQALAKLTHTSVANIKNGVQTVGPTWGSSVTNAAIEALVIFFVVVGIYISIRFEPKMALSAFLAMLHDVVVAVGVYSIFNFQVTPDTVVAILTILGYSLYDTVVVFDRVRDNTRNLGSTGRISYPQLVNLSMNQTLARSINTSAVAIIPVLAVLLVGAELLGASTLQEYGLALFVGLLSGAYSSIFIASPILVMLKARESRWVAIEQRLQRQSDRLGPLSPAAAAALATQMSIAAGGQPQRSGGGSGGGGAAPGAPAKRSGPIRPGSAATAVLNRQDVGGGAAGGAGGGPQGPKPRKGKGKRRR